MYREVFLIENTLEGVEKVITKDNLSYYLNNIKRVTVEA